MGGERPSHKGEQQLQVIHCVASVVAFVSPILTPGGWGGGRWSGKRIHQSSSMRGDPYYQEQEDIHSEGEDLEQKRPS